MSGEEDRAGVIQAHQELVDHVERSTGMIRGLSALTIAVSLVLSISYLYQLILPALGVTSVTVNLADPANQAAELLVFLLALVWLYVGSRDFLFSSRIRSQVRQARADEAEIEKKIVG